MDKKNLKKIIKEFFTPFAKLNGFIFYKPSIMIRIKNDTLHIICFELPQEGFNCSISIQPLYIPSEDISLSFGNRINNFKTRTPGMWGFGSNRIEIEKELLQIRELLEANVLEWFDEVGHPEGIIGFIESGLTDDTSLIVGFPPVLKNQYLGFSYLYVHDLENGIKLLQDAVEKRKDDKWEWVLKENEIINNVIYIAKNEPNNVAAKLNEFIRISKNNLKIKI